jgi:hypothetical protein
LPASPRQHRVRHACTAPVPRHAQGLRPRSTSIGVRLPRSHALAGGQTAVAVLLVCAARPGLDAGVLRYYSTNACKGGEKTAEDPWKERHSRLHAGAAAIRSAPVRGCEGERKEEHGQSAAAPVPTFGAPWGAMRCGKAQRLLCLLMRELVGLDAAEAGPRRCASWRSRGRWWRGPTARAT